MEPAGIPKVSLAELLSCFEEPVSEEQAWAICFQCCRKIEQLAHSSALRSVFIKGSESIFIHADGTASFKVYHESVLRGSKSCLSIPAQLSFSPDPCFSLSDVGSIQQSEDKLLEYLGRAIYEALDWGIDSQLERELSDPLEKLLCLMLKLDEKATKPPVTLQDVIKACEEQLSRPSEATSHYEITCKNLFTEYMELQELLAVIQTSKERLREMAVEDRVENPIQKKKTHGASPWHSVVCELQAGVSLRKAAKQPRRCASPKERIRTPYELLLDDIQHKRYALQRVTIKQKHRSPKADVAALKPHLEPETTPKLPANPCLSSTRPSGVSCISSGLAANCTPPMSAPPPGDIKPKCFLSTGQWQLPPHRGRSRSLERGLQSKELDCPFSTKWPSPTIADLIETRYARMVLFQGGSAGVFPRAKICFSCHKQMFLKWPYRCYLCSRVVCCDCCIKMSMPYRTCVHLPLQFLKFLRLSEEEDPATQEQKSSKLLHEIEQQQYLGIPVVLEPCGLAQPLCCYMGTMANWLTVDICIWCEQFLLNVTSSQQHSIPVRRFSWA
ncbi:protein spire homolog 1-like [Serinus canaria]|uniref:protein spire homolog 1-like n=1 Tax=Serinus canaria TaxID=9135 RepID=UPI0021CC80FE|nr:protein spire homolog 1-like [Serinus canaria]